MAAIAGRVGVMNGQRVKATETGSLGVVIGDPWKQGPDWSAVAVLFDDGTGGAVRVDALTAVLDGQPIDPATIALVRELMASPTASELAGLYARSPFTTVPAWLESFGSDGR